MPSCFPLFLIWIFIAGPCRVCDNGGLVEERRHRTPGVARSMTHRSKSLRPSMPSATMSTPARTSSWSARHGGRLCAAPQQYGRQTIGSLARQTHLAPGNVHAFVHDLNADGWTPLMTANAARRRTGSGRHRAHAERDDSARMRQTEARAQGSRQTHSPHRQTGPLHHLPQHEAGMHPAHPFDAGNAL